MELNAATLSISLPQFFIYSDSEHASRALIIKQEYFVLDDSKWKAAQCSVWLNNASGNGETVYAGIISDSKTYWTRLQLNDASFIPPEKDDTVSVSNFIKQNIHGTNSFTVWSLRLQPGVNHISIDFGLNNFSNELHAENDTVQWKLFSALLPSVLVHSEIKTIFQISPRKNFNYLSMQPSTGWQQADSFLRFTGNGNSDSTEVFYSYLRTNSALNANEVSWEAAFQQLEVLSKKNLNDVLWRPVTLQSQASSKNKTIGWWILAGVAALILLLTIGRRKII